MRGENDDNVNSGLILNHLSGLYNIIFLHPSMTLKFGSHNRNLLFAVTLRGHNIKISKSGQYFLHYLIDI